MDELRKNMAWRTRRIIMNNDGNDAHPLAVPEETSLHPGDLPTAETFLSKRTSPLINSQVDSIFYCTGVFNLYTHRSRLAERQNDWCLELEKREGRDTLEIMIDWCRRAGKEIFWSMRMNDTHDAYLDPSLMTQWKKNHLHCLMGKPGRHFPYGSDRWSALNYETPEVRERVFHLLQEVCCRYDVDGVELDFYRHPVFFKPQMMGDPVTQNQCDLMTELLRRIHTMTSQVSSDRGRPLLIAVRVPDSIPYARAIGLDLVRWLREGLVDLLIGTCYNHFEPWENFVALAKPYQIPVYACLSGSRLVDSSDPVAKGDIRAWRGEALNAWRAGVNGIYTFNRFLPTDPIFQELGNPDTLEKSDHTFRFNGGDLNEARSWVKDGDKYFRI